MPCLLLGLIVPGLLPRDPGLTRWKDYQRRGDPQYMWSCQGVEPEHQKGRQCKSLNDPLEQLLPMLLRSC